MSDTKITFTRKEMLVLFLSLLNMSIFVWTIPNHFDRNIDDNQVEISDNENTVRVLVIQYQQYMLYDTQRLIVKANYDQLGSMAFVSGNAEFQDYISALGEEYYRIEMMSLESLGYFMGITDEDISKMDRDEITETFEMANRSWNELVELYAKNINDLENQNIELKNSRSVLISIGMIIQILSTVLTLFTKKDRMPNNANMQEY